MQTACPRDAAARSTVELLLAAHPVPAPFLGAVERLVGALHHFLRRLEALARLGAADAHRDREDLVGALEVAHLGKLARTGRAGAALRAFLAALRPVLAADGHLVRLYRRAHRLEARHHFAQVAA